MEEQTNPQTRKIKCEFYHDNFQNYKRYNIRKAQLVIADIPYNIGENAYGSNPMWYVGGDNANGESKFAKQAFFNGDGEFRIAEFMHFCSKMLIKEPKEKGSAPAMIVFCAFEQIQTVQEYGQKYGFMKSYPLIFCKNYSALIYRRKDGKTVLSLELQDKNRNSVTIADCERVHPAAI